MTKPIIHTIKPKRRTAAQTKLEIRMLGIKLIELERRLTREQGPAAVAEYREAVAAKVEQDADIGNVVRLRGHRSP